MFKKLFFLALSQFIILCSLNSQVIINEFSTSNLESFVDEFEKTEDWVELHNMGSTDVDISGWHLSDKEDKPGKFRIPDGTIIPANGYMVFLCSGRNLVGTENIHTNFKLAQTTGNDIIMLTDPDSTVVNMFTLDLTLVESSRCRTTDGADEWMVCTSPTYGTSNNGSTQYKGYTVPPTFDMDAGFYTAGLTVSITNNEPNSQLRYTTDGTNPNLGDPIYSGPIDITATTVIKAQAFSDDPDILPGKMEFATYFIDENEFTVRVFSVAANDVLELAGGQGELIPIGSIEVFDIDGSRISTSFGSLNRHGQDSWVLDHRSLDWISRDEMGYNKAVDAQLFDYSDRTEYQRFMFRNSGDDNYPAINDGNHDGSTHIRDEYVHTLSLEGGMEVDTRAVARVVLFLNGEYWGLYGMRERPVDHDYTSEYYDQDKFNIQYLSTWGDTEAEYGGDQAFYDWEEIRDFMLNNDMGVQENFDLAGEEYNYLSLIDYMLVNLNTVARDWLNYNTGWWRGLDPDGDHKKWGYIIWDMDATFDYYINYTNVPNTDPDAVPCDIGAISDYMDEFFGPISTLSNPVIDTTNYDFCPTIMDGSCPYPADDPNLIQLFGTETQWFNGMLCCEQGWTDQCEMFYGWIEQGFFQNQGNVGAHEKVFIKLIEESPQFSQLYFGRYADMMNTVYSCENMNETLDRMVDVIDPEMDRQIARWGGTRTEWESNLQDLRDFIDARCTLLDDGLVECYGVDGPYELTLIAEPDFAGEIDINTLDIREYPWTGEYFGGMENTIKARVFDEWTNSYEFDYWESRSGNVIAPDVNNFLASITLTQPDTLVAVFKQISSVSDLEKELALELFPNPTSSFVNLEYTLADAANVQIDLVSTLGKRVTTFTEYNGLRSSGKHSHVLNLADKNISAGMYLLQINVDDKVLTKKVNYIK